jgi:hypothetical protein
MRKREGERVKEQEGERVREWESESTREWEREIDFRKLLGGLNFYLNSTIEHIKISLLRWVVIFWSGKQG